MFLPASGRRRGTWVYFVGDCGRYWSSTEGNSDYASCVYFHSSLLDPQYAKLRNYGLSVRLVKDVEADSGTPDTTSFPLISTVPEVIPMGYDGEVTIIFNPNEGNKGMQLATACYAHTGLITSASHGDSDWKYVVEEWRYNTSKTQLTKDGNNWKLVISNIYDFYRCPADTEIKKLAFVFHDGPSGYREGKTAEGTDIFVVLEEVEEPTDPDETEGANDYMLDNFKIGGYGFFDLGDPIAGTDTLLTLSTGDEVTCQLAPSIAYVWDDGITLGNNGLTGAGYFFRVENYVYTITDSPNGTYNGYIILGDAISGFDLAVDTIASEDILPYTGKAGQLLDVDMYGDAWASLYNIAEDTIDEEYYNAIMDKCYASHTGTQFYYYDFNTEAQIIYSGNVSYFYLKEDNQTGELYYDLKLEWYDNVNEGRSYGLLAETEVNEEGEKIITGIVKPYDMRFIHKHYQQLPSTEEVPTEAPARVQAKAEVRAIYDF